MKTAYICDGRAPCSGRLGCSFAEIAIPNPCTHTTNSLYAVNGACAHPENHPERFVIVGEDTDGTSLYFEKSLERCDSASKCEIKEARNDVADTKGRDVADGLPGQRN